MKFAICNETFGDWPVEKALSYAAEAGYTGWEVAPFTLANDVRDISSLQRSEYRKKVTEAGLEIVGLHWLLAKTEGFHLTSANAPTRKATADYLCELARLCRDLGGSVMVLGSPLQRNRAEGMTEDESFMHAANVLRAVVPTLEKQQVKIALEPLGPVETNFMNTAADAGRLQALVGSDMIGLHLDMKAMSSEAEPMVDVIKANRNWLLHFHANDPNRQGPGMGDVEVAPVFSALNEINYQGWVSVEVFDYDPGVERLVTESMANMRSALAAT